RALAARPRAPLDPGRSQPARAWGRPRECYPVASQADQAGSIARTIDAMAHAAGRGRGMRRHTIGEIITTSTNQWPALTVCGHWPSSILEAAITACVRLSTPSFCKIAETCALTVASETLSS